MSKEHVKPGQTVPVSGQYTANGGKTEVTLVKGDKVPPTSRPGQEFTLVDKTKHKR